jgi:hypothetical protein
MTTRGPWRLYGSSGRIGEIDARGRGREPRPGSEERMSWSFGAGSARRVARFGRGRAMSRSVVTALAVVSFAFALPACTQESRDQIRNAAGSLTPSRTPSALPTPSVRPTRSPRPTEEPTPTEEPSEAQPTRSPRPTEEPSEAQPTQQPSRSPRPTEEPSEAQPTQEPTPTEEPTQAPTTPPPTQAPPTEQPSPQPTLTPTPVEPSITPSAEPSPEPSSKTTERAAGWVLLVLVLLGSGALVAMLVARNRRRRRQSALDAAAACVGARDALAPLVGAAGWTPEQAVLAVGQIDRATGLLRSLEPPDDAARLAADRAALALGSAADVLSRPEVPGAPGETRATTLGLAVRELDLAVAEL